MHYNRDILKSAIEIQQIRPKADLSIEQYLMTPESMFQQVTKLRQIFKNKKILFLGDDDHMSALFAKYLDTVPSVVEYDPRVRNSLNNLYRNWGINKAEIRKYDARHPLPKIVRADAFYINPPYSSKNEGKGAKVWISRVATAVPVGSTSVLVYPIDENLPWTLTCLHNVIEYAYSCGFMITAIDRDVHTYGYLPKDPGLLSSNIFLYKFENSSPTEIIELDNDSLYR